MGNASAQAVNLYALLGVPVDADGARLRHVIALHHTAKLLPEAILQKAERYLLSDGLRLQYNLYLHNLSALAPQKSVEHLNLYAHLRLPHTASAAEIQAALSAQVKHMPLQTWLLARKWLLHPRLRERYDGVWTRRFGNAAGSVWAEETVAVAIHTPELVADAQTKTPWALLATAALATAVGGVALERTLSRPQPVYIQQTVLPPLLVAVPASQAFT